MSMNTNSRRDVAVLLFAGALIAAYYILPVLIWGPE